MREFIECKSRATAWRRAPWAEAIVKCEGGFMAFKYVTDAQRWSGQETRPKSSNRS